MQAKSKKQLNYFRLVKSYKDSGYKGLFNTWKEIFGRRPFPPSEYINKIVDTSQKIKDSDLLDLTSGVEGEAVVGDKRDIKVGYWALFNGRYRDSKGIPKEGKFIAQIKKVDFNNSIANFNRFEFYNRFGARTETPYRVVVTNPEFQFLDYAYFKDIIKTGKSVKEISETREGSIIKEIPAGFGDEAFSDYTGTLSESWNTIFQQTIKMMIDSLKS